MDTPTKDLPLGISTEVTSFILRMGPGHTKYGDPWETPITGVIFDHVAHLSAVQGWDDAYRKLIHRELCKLGCTRLRFYRIRKNGTKKLVDIPIPPIEELV